MSQNMSTEALIAEARTPQIASGIKQVFAVYALVATKKPVPLELAHAVAVLTTKGHLRYSERARRLMFTEAGAKFAKQSKKYAPLMGF